MVSTSLFKAAAGERKKWFISKSIAIFTQEWALSPTTSQCQQEVVTCISQSCFYCFACVQIHGGGRGSGADTCSLLNQVPACSLTKDTQLKPELTDRTRAASHFALWIFHLHLLRNGLTGRTTCSPSIHTFTWVLRIQTRVVHMQNRHFNHWASPRSCLLLIFSCF